MSIFDDEKYGPLYDINPIKPLIESPKPDVDWDSLNRTYESQQNFGNNGINSLDNAVTQFNPDMSHVRPDGSLDLDRLQRNTDMARFNATVKLQKKF